MLLLLCLLFCSYAHTMPPKPVIKPIIKIDSLECLRDLKVDLNKDVSHIEIDNWVMALAMHKLTFPDDNDPYVVEMIRDRIERVKTTNPPSYDNLTFYTLYKTSRLNFKNPSLTTVRERLYSTKHEEIKEKNWVGLTMAKMYVKLITQQSYQDYLYEKDKERKRALICETIRAGALFPVIPRATNKRRKSNDF